MLCGACVFRFLSSAALGATMRWLLSFAAVLWATACSDSGTQQTNSDDLGQVGPVQDDDVRPALAGPGVSRAIVDGRDGGGRVVYFLRPITADSGSGTQAFDDTAKPTVTVCKTRNGRCVATVARFPWNDGRGSAFCVVAERARLEWYVAKWIAPRNHNGTYQVQIHLDGRIAATADLNVVGSRRELQSVPNDVVGVTAGTVLPLRFRIEVAPGGGLAEPISVGLDSSFVEVDDGSAAIYLPTGTFPQSTTITLRRGGADPEFQAHVAREVGDFEARIVVPEVFTVRAPGRPLQTVVVEMAVPALAATEGAVAIIPLRLSDPQLGDMTPVIWVEQIASARQGYAAVAIQPQAWREEGGEFRLDVWQGGAQRAQTGGTVAAARRISPPPDNILGKGLLLQRYCNDYIRHPRLRSPVERFPLRFVDGVPLDLQSVDLRTVSTRIEAPEGTEIRAMLGGTVARASQGGVVIRTTNSATPGRPVVVRLLNLASVAVMQGDQVAQGQLVGTSAGPTITVEFGRGLGDDTGYLPRGTSSSFPFYISHWQVATCLAFQLVHDYRRDVAALDQPIIANPIITWEAGEPTAPADTILFRPLQPYTVRTSLVPIGVPVYSNREMTVENGTPLFGLNTISNWPYGFVPQGTPVLHPSCSPLRPAAIEFVAPATGPYTIVFVATTGDFGSVRIRRIAPGSRPLEFWEFAGLTEDLELRQGDRIRYEVDPNGDCGGDTTPISIWASLGHVQQVNDH